MMVRKPDRSTRRSSWPPGPCCPLISACTHTIVTTHNLVGTPPCRLMPRITQFIQPKEASDDVS
jgi:hypothetical protein